MQRQEDKNLLKKALYDVIAKQYNDELMCCEEDAVCSWHHYERMVQIIGMKTRSVKKKWSKKSLLAILLAIVILLTGCTATYIYRNEIREFIEEIYEKYIKVTYDNGKQETGPGLSETYTLTYLPQGYEMKGNKLTQLYVLYSYSDINGESLLFRQYPLDGSEFGMDAENGYTEIYEFESYQIYIRILDKSYHYVWNDGKYAMNLISTLQLPEEELRNIIKGIKIE